MKVRGYKTDLPCSVKTGFNASAKKCQPMLVCANCADEPGSTFLQLLKLFATGQSSAV